MIKNKLLMALGVGLCLFMAVDNLIEAYKEYVPVAKPGECIRVRFSKTNHIILMIVSNHSKHSEALYIYDDRISLPYEMSYFDMRRFNAEKVMCNEKIN